MRALLRFFGRHRPRNEDYGVAGSWSSAASLHTVMIVSDGVSSAERRISL